jgi:uncharacterized metal-binding protein
MKHKMNVIDNAMEKYKDPSELRLFQNATINEQQAYMNIRGRVIAVRPRVLEIIKFSRMMGWENLGIAFCTGLGKEANRVVEIFESAGFNVFSVCCKCGKIDKTKWGIEGKDKIMALKGESDAFEVGCNPITQAAILASAEVELNIIVGLCIGHDIHFTKFAKGPVTTLIVKDRVTGHNPFASLYSAYHHPRMWEEE